MFRRLLKYRFETDSSAEQPTTHFPTTLLPISASSNVRALKDSTNMRGGLFRVALNQKNLSQDMNESGFGSHCEN